MGLHALRTNSVLKTLAESNDKGSWHGWEMQLRGSTSRCGNAKEGSSSVCINLAMYEQAKSFSESVQSGNVEVKRENDDVKRENDQTVQKTRGDGFPF